MIEKLKAMKKIKYMYKNIINNFIFNLLHC